MSNFNNAQCAACFWSDYAHRNPLATLRELEPTPHQGARRWEIHNPGPTGTILHGDPRACLCELIGGGR